MVENLSKTDRAREFVQEHLSEDILDSKTLPLRETAINFAMSILRLVVTAVNVAYSAMQFAFSLMLAIGDLITKGLAKIMPAPKPTPKGEGVPK